MDKCERCGEGPSFGPAHKTVDGKKICGDCAKELKMEGGAVEGFQGFVPDPSKKEHHYPRKPMKHHIKPKHMLEQVDMDVDQIPAEELEPGAAQFWPEMGISEREYDAEREEGPSAETQYKRDMQELDRKKDKKASITSTRLLKMAEELESPENEVLVAADDSELDKTAASLVKAASFLRLAAEELAAEEKTVAGFTADKLEEIAAVAEAFSESGDELLMKQAATLDDLLITLGSPKNRFLFSTAKEDGKNTEDELKKIYKDTLEQEHKSNGIKEAVEAIEKSPVYKQYRGLEQGLSQRYCPDHAGTQMARTAENTYSCPLDHKSYNWSEGFETIKGNKIPPAQVQEQTSFDNADSTGWSSFDSRQDRMQNRE